MAAVLVLKNMKNIQLRGVRTHNLKDISVEIPRNKLTVITGLSGSGKSSLAFDTIYAEGQRRYVESLSSYARQFLSMMEKPEVDYIEGLSPAISIEQKSTSHNPRSTVGTVTEVYDYLRLLFARAGEPRCPDHGEILAAQSVSQMVDRVMTLDSGTKWFLSAPIIREKKGEHHQIFSKLRSLGYIRAYVDGELILLEDPPTLELRKKHNIDVVIDRFSIRDDLPVRLAESIERALELGEGIAKVVSLDNTENEILFSSRFACSKCGYSLTELEPRLFSFNNPSGACITCDGLGYLKYFDEELVVSNRDLSLSAGAVKGWDRRNSYYFRLMSSIAKHYEFEIDTPFSQLGRRIQTVLLYGSAKETISFSYLGSDGKSYKREHPFEGIIPNMERRLQETDSPIIKEEMSKFLSSKPCRDCFGSRLNKAAVNVFFQQKRISDLVTYSIGDATAFFKDALIQKNKEQVATKIIDEIIERLTFMENIGLDYLTLDRSADTLSGGEAQRIRLASQIGAGLVGVMYVLDEPSIGLHQRDNKRLLKTLYRLRDLGNTVIVVEHDEEAILAADHVIDIGPGAGVHGGEIIVSGTPNNVKKAKGSLTGDYLSGKKSIAVPTVRKKNQECKKIKLTGAEGNNLKSVDFEVPLGALTCVTGVSGSGKSTLVNDTLYAVAARALNRASVKPAKYVSHEGFEELDKVVNVDQSPIGRTPRSNPATYTGLFGPLRELFSATPEARSRGYKPGRFSFNVKGGRCEACQGDGLIKVEMHFLPDLYVECDLCKGSRYNRETLEITYKGLTIHEVLELTIEEALQIFEAVPSLSRRLATLIDVGLSYLKLGQSATTLSGGEAQRIKLAKELSRTSSGRTLYILDEPTTGLHFHDVAQLLKVLESLKSLGNTIVIIEHNLDVVKTADWVIDMGPEGGSKGGLIVDQGTPEEIASGKSPTAESLRKVLGK